MWALCLLIDYMLTLSVWKLFEVFFCLKEGWPSQHFHARNFEWMKLVIIHTDFFSINSAYSALGSESKECCSFDFNTSPVYGFATPPLLTFEVALCPVLTHVDTGKSMDQYTWAKRGWCRMETQFKKNERNKLTFFGWELCLSGVWRFFSIIFIPKFWEDGWSQRVRRAFGHPNSEEDLFGENSLPPEPTDILYVEFSTVSRIESSLFAPDFLWRDCFFFVFFLVQVLVPLGTHSATSSVSRFADADDWKPETYDGDGSTGCLLHSLRSWRFHTGQPFSANPQVSPVGFFIRHLWWSLRILWFLTTNS